MASPSGRQHWEGKVMDAGGRAIVGGVSTEDVKKKNDILWLEFKPEKGSWAVGLLGCWQGTS